MKMKKGVVILSAALIVVMVVMIYFIVVSVQAQAQINQYKLNFSNKADIFDTKLHDLLQEHTFLLINTVRRSLDSSASYNASLVALQNNINEFSVLLTPIYGSNAQQLASLWNQKANIFISYSNDLKAGNPNANANFAANASAYEQLITNFWISPTNPYPVLSKTIIQPEVNAHMNDIKAAVDDWNAKNYPQYFVDLEVAYKQIGQYADVIAAGIVQQNRQYFLS